MLKTMGYRTLFMDHYPRKGYMGDTDPPFWYVMLTKVMSIYITLSQGCIETMSQHLIK